MANETLDLNSIDEDRWRNYLGEANADPKWKEFHAAEDKKREVVRSEIRHLLDRFLSGKIDVEQFREEFDRRTKTEWDVFGLKGMSGAMCLNKLVKHVKDRVALTHQLKAVLPVPKDEAEAIERLSAFAKFLDEEIASGRTTKGDLQPARASFLISSFWHMQDTEAWPIWYASGRKVLEKEGILKVTGNASNDYFAFRDAFNAVKSAIDVPSWQCEHLLAYRDKSATKSTSVVVVSPPADVIPADIDEPGTAPDESTHTQVQWLLAKIGQKVGCQVWIAVNDRSKLWKGQKLGELSIESLPNLGLDSASQKTISYIDVVWLKGKHIQAVFEVEHTTSIYSGLLRMADLLIEVPNLNFDLYLVAPASRISKVRAQLLRPVFRNLELHDRCSFFSDEDLIEAAEGMLKWASDPAVIDQLASVATESVMPDDEGAV